MTTDPRDILATRAAMAPAPGISPGVSGMFTAPSPNLDPSLFEGSTLLAGVRQWILDTGYSFLDRHYNGAHNWATIWIAGSGASYQWAADRSPRDLDILIGVKMVTFKRHNPQYQGVDESTVAHFITQTLRTLDEQTALQPIGTDHYEVTWYVNPGAADIRDIHPYAAYDVTHNRWTVPPPDLPSDWSTRSFPVQWWAQVGREKKHVQQIIGEFLQARSQYLTSHDQGHRTNASSALDYATNLATVYFEDLHNNRRVAFSPQGEGYKDWNNFRWQAHKRNGVVDALHSLAVLRKAAREQSNEETYGHALASSEQALATASLLNAHLNSLEVR